MARLSIATFSNASGVTTGTPMQVLSVSISGTSAQSSAITGPPNGMMFAYLCTDTACDIEVGTNPTAVAGTSMSLPAGVPMYIGIAVGHKIAAVTHA